MIRSALACLKATVVLQLDFTLGEVLYRVRREFRGKALATNAELFKNDVLVAKGVMPVNDEIVKVLHMERDAFRRSVFSVKLNSPRLLTPPVKRAKRRAKCSVWTPSTTSRWP